MKVCNANDVKKQRKSYKPRARQSRDRLVLCGLHYLLFYSMFKISLLGRILKFTLFFYKNICKFQCITVVLCMQYHTCIMFTHCCWNGLITGVMLCYNLGSN